GFGERIEHPHGMPYRDPARRLQPVEESSQIKLGQIGSQRGVDAEQVALQGRYEWQIMNAAQRIDDGAIQQGGTVAGHKRIQPLPIPLPHQNVMMRGGMAEGGA